MHVDTLGMVALGRHPLASGGFRTGKKIADLGEERKEWKDKSFASITPNSKYCINVAATMQLLAVLLLWLMLHVWRS